MPPSIRDGALLAVAGAGLLGSQYVASRELGSTFFVTELSIVATTVVTLIGPSLSYALGDRLRRAGAWLSVWALLAFLVHLSLPFSIRAVVGWLGATHPIIAAAVTAGGVALLCGYYAVLLPLRATTASLSFLYGAELCGALLTLLLLAAAPSYRFVLLGFLLIPSGVAGVTFGRHAALLSLTIATLVWFASPSLDRAVSTHYFRHYHGLGTPNVIESVYSPYQRVDVVTDSGDTALFLDGVPFYRSGDLDAFNVILAELPGSLLPKRGSALVVGSGSFSSAARLHRLGYSVQVMELDGLVADLGFRHFASIHKLKTGEVQLQIADARQALSQRQELFDLIVLDVPAPYRIQTALLHAPSFYRQVAAHLAPGGVVAISLCDGLHEPLGKRIASSAAQVFAELMVVESNTVGLGVLYGATRLPFAVSEVAAALKEKDPQGGEVTPDRLIRNLVLDASPLSERDLLGVLLLSRQALSGQ